jgi:protein involved in polysaccharide export with SLBB domain
MLDPRHGLLDPTKTIAIRDENETVAIRTVVDPMEDYRELIPNSEPPSLADLEWSEEDYVMGPGDVVNVYILDLYVEGTEAPVQTTISNEGYVQLPMVPDRVKVGGLTPDQARQAIAHVYAPDYLQNPQVRVEAVQKRQSFFSVTGAVARPSLYNISRKDFRLLEAITDAGDVGQSNLKYVYVIRQTEAGKKLRRATEAPQGLALPEAPGQLPPLPGAESRPQSGLAPRPPTDIMTELRKYEPGVLAAPAPTQPAAAAPAAASSPASAAASQEFREDMKRVLAPGAPVTGSRPAKPDLSSFSEVSTAGAGPESAPAQRPAFEWRWENEQWVRVPTGAPTPAPSPAGEAATGVAARPGGEVPQTPSAPAGAPGAEPGPQDPFGWAQADMSHLVRVIAVNLEKLKEADPKQNIIIRDGDTILVPPLKVGEFYVMGEVLRPGVFNLTGRKLTVKMALTAAGGFSGLAWPSNSVLIRRLDNDQEIRVPLRLDRIMAGDEPEIEIRADDVIAVGSHVAAPFLAVIRNAFRMTYGFGFIYDRNFAETNFGQSQSLSAGARDFFGD